MALYEYFKRGPVLPTLRTCGEQATRRLLESHRQSRPEIKLSRLEASTIATRRKGTGREVRRGERFDQGGLVLLKASRSEDNRIISEKALIRTSLRSLKHNYYVIS